MCKAAERIVFASNALNTTGCISRGEEGRIQLGWGFWPSGCLLIRVSRTVGESEMVGSTWSAKCNTPPSVLLVRRLRAALHFPECIRLAKVRARGCLEVWWDAREGSRC